MTNSSICFDRLTFGFAGRDEGLVLKELSASFGRDRISLVTGPSGCGKSTLLYLAAGLYPHHAGEIFGGAVRVDGVEPASLDPQDRAALVGMVFQNPSQQFCMDTVEHELLFCLGNACVPREEMPAIVHRALAFCGIEHLRSRALRSLSGGEKQMVVLACVLALKPAWILLDEPFANVDDEAARQLVARVLEAHRLGIGVLVVDHRIDHWIDVADDVFALENGHSLRHMSMDELTSRAIQRERSWRDLGDALRLTRAWDSDTPVRLNLRDVGVQQKGRPILESVNVDFREGGVYAILGTSSSGKSTLFDAMLGATPYSGEMTLDGQPLHRRNRIPPGSIGFVSQNPHDQFIADTVYGEVSTSLDAAGSRQSADDEAVEDILRSIALWGHRHFSPYMLSQGQQRRLGVAALLTYDCKVLVCDEPTYAQDDARAVATMAALLETVRERQMTLVFSTHDEMMAMHVADVVLRMEGGTLHEIGQPGVQAGWAGRDQPGAGRGA